jgi:hypothetical protein
MLLDAYRATALCVLLAVPDAVAPPGDARRTARKMEADADSRTVASQDQGGTLITSSSIGPVTLGMTLAAVRDALPAASIERASDGDGAALVRVAFGAKDSLLLWAGEDDPGAPIDWSHRIITITTFSESFHTAEGVRPGWRVEDVIKVFGSVREIVVSEIESREFITFANQPEWLTFRLDYAGLFPPGLRSTRQFRPGAKILGIAISSL